MSDHKPTVVARAVELARTGDFRSNEEIIKALDREGYDQARLHFDSRTVKALLRDALKEGQALAASEEAAFKRQIDHASQS